MSEAPAPEYILKTEGVVTRYGNIEALKGIDIQVKKGTITAIIGANGAGKSTLLLTISGILKPSSGSVSFLGASIDSLKPHAIVERGITHVPEGRRIFSSLTVYENLMLGAYIRPDNKAVEKELENIYGLFPILKERLHQKGGTLSGGEQQMLAISRGILSKPQLLLIDELSLGLAPIVVDKLFEAIRMIRDAGTTILLVEQNAVKALKYSDHAFVMEVGKIALAGKSSELLNSQDIRKHYLGE